MSVEEIKTKMLALADPESLYLHDEEGDHVEADELLKALIREFAEDEEVEEILRLYDNVKKWYA